ncbi:cytochrome d ubiquinol oxidase subunit II [Wolinella succinogenes]|uniref:cytochrome d ubiquinol oxidase subunit II n=1 Tax=Wolinella succinogenes TaxID=844 RepID=UPI002409B482|nr:cytochrome d ubiquinol oxidase subunit II [Wolinella succinogenes]
MFESWSLEALQVYWWVIVSLLGGLLVFMMFVQGGQTLLFFLSENELEKSVLINSLGRKWELTFTTLVLFGGACFAAFPLFYATSFGGAYWVWLLILFCFIIQAVSYEYRRKPDNFLGQKSYEAFLYINGALAPFLIGAAVSTFFSGSPFALSENFFPLWQTPFRGLETLLVPYVYLLGLALFFLSRIGASLYFINHVNEVSIRQKARKAVLRNTLYFLPFFLAFLGWILTKEGWSYDLSGDVSVESYKYAKNLLALPWIGVMMIAGVGGVLLGIYQGALTESSRGIFAFGAGVVLCVMGVFLLAGLNGTPFYPSYTHPEDSLTIKNASSSHYTLSVMAYVSLLVPLVLGYITYVWRLMDKKKITTHEVGGDSHLY